MILPDMAHAKVYAPRNRGTAPPEFPFGMIFIRDGVEETHEFLATPTMGWQDLRSLVPLMVGNNADEAMTAHAIKVIDSVVRRVLRNDDGTPEKWHPAVVDGHFTAPNGDHTPVGLLPDVEAFDAGSSRRRWTHLMTVDDDVTIELDQMISLMEDLISVAAERPTQRSTP